MTALAAPEFTDSWPGWARFLMGTPLRIVIILVAAWVAAAVLHAVIRHIAKRAARLPSRGAAARATASGADAAYLASRREARFMTLASVFRSASTVAVWVLAICLVLESIGVNPGLIATSVGVLGVGLGLGAQTLVKDMLSGLWMLIEDQYGLGDLIDTGDAKGVVESMSLRITTLRDESGVVWYVPNGSITRIGNRSQATQADAQAGAS
ncbi:MAG: mechanosensitive ion channel family protein [Bifidobacteriaceae bacterium]|jgi:small conductance mechanosensitive channel|nr:mechanosensitive ion channel family protein [Bifidobacteriaceae bacterium]